MRLCTVIRTPTGTSTYRSDVLIDCGSHANEVTKEPERANERERDRVDASVGFAPRPIKWLLRNMAGKVLILPLCNSGVLSTGTMRRRGDEGATASIHPTITHL